MTSPDDEAVNAHLAARRRAIFARVVDRLSARGTPIYDDPKVVQLVDDWINGRIGLADVTQGYSEIRRAAPDLPVSTAERHTPESRRDKPSQEKLLAELEQMIGIFEPDGPLKN